MTRAFASLPVILLCCSTLVGCGDSASLAAPSSTSSTVTTEFFVGSLAPFDSGFYSFSVAKAGNVSISLASLTTSKTGTTLATPLSVGLGTPAGLGCAVGSSVEGAAALTAQITESSPAGIRCVEIHDPGSLTAAVTFVVRIVHP